MPKNKNKTTTQKKQRESRGNRTGSGRPLKYGEPTKTFRKKVPISKIVYIEEVVSKELEVFLVKNKI